jgi:Zn-finger nucleic acid-binding protein
MVFIEWEVGWMNVPDMIGIKNISIDRIIPSPVKVVTMEECISKVLSSPDLKCPTCGKHLEVWLYGDIPIYRCSICGGLGFKMDTSRIISMTDKERKGGEVVSPCPGCGKGMKRCVVGKVKLDSCPGCDWVFVEDGGEVQTEEGEYEGGCSHYAALLRSLGIRYEQLISKL